MELIVRIMRFPQGGLVVGILSAVISGIAIFGFGAHPLTLMVVLLTAITAYMKVCDRLEGRWDEPQE